LTHRRKRSPRAGPTGDARATIAIPLRLPRPSTWRAGRTHISGEATMAKIVLVLYDDPVDGYPESYARDSIPKLSHYPGGQTLPTPKKIDFTPGELLGSVSGELGLRKFLEGLGHQLVVTSDKDGPGSVFERELADAEIVIS